MVIFILQSPFSFIESLGFTLCVLVGVPSENPGAAIKTAIVDEISRDDESAD